MRRSALILVLALCAPTIATAEPETAAKSEDLLRTADEIVKKVARIRGLRPKRRVAKGVLGREEIRDKLMARIRKEYGPEEIAVEERMLKRLGLLPKDTDYEKAVMDLLLEQIAGFYDPFDRKLYIADWLPQELQIPTLTHEIAHALQDQRFGLKSYATPIKENGDRQLARSALVEGDGTAVMIEAMMPGIELSQLPDSAFSSGWALGSSLMPAFDRAPRFLRETLVFPYMHGLAFIRHIRKRKPWSAVDAVYGRPPESTEQIIHPEKYYAREKPIDVRDVKIPTLKDAKLLRRDVLGELVTRLYLEVAVSHEQARVASEGWGGDRVAVYETAPGEPLLLVHLSVWDSQADADEFARAVSRVLARVAGRPEVAPPAIYEEAPGRQIAVERRGDRVLQLLGVPADLRERIADDVWHRWRVGGKRASLTKGRK